MTILIHSAVQKRVPLDPGWKSVLECAALEVFEMMAGTRLVPFVPPIAVPGVESVPERRSEQTAMVGMAGALCGMTTIRCSAETAIRLAAKMAGDDSRQGSEHRQRRPGRALQHGRRELQGQGELARRPLHALRPHSHQWR